jgi:methanogenic corrinoid protein MtbC1
MEGWDTHYLGASTPAEGIIQLLASRQIDVLGISATLPGHLDEVAALIRRVRAAPGCEKLIVLVGGYPFNIDRALWEKIGADGHGSDAAVAISLATQLTVQSEARV